MFPVQCEEIKINHLTLLLVGSCGGQINYIEDFKWRLHIQFGVAFWRVVLREVYFEGPSRIWRAMKTSILHIVSEPNQCVGLTKFFAILSHLTCKNSDIMKMHVNGHALFRSWHVLWLWKKIKHMLIDPLEIEMTYITRQLKYYKL